MYILNESSFFCVDSSIAVVWKLDWITVANLVFSSLSLGSADDRVLGTAWMLVAALDVGGTSATSHGGLQTLALTEKERSVYG